MILRGMAIGFVLWVLNAAIFRFAGQHFFLPQAAPSYLLFVLVSLLGAGIVFVLLKVMREAPGDEGEAAVTLAFPSLLLNALLTHEFAMVFPNLDAGLDGVYGGLAMVYAAAMVFTGLLMTRLAPEDERI